MHQTKSTKPHRRSNGEANKLAPEDRPVHDWYRFVLSFPPHLVRDYLRSFGIGPGKRVLDPFCGTGTTIIECKKLDISSVGVEANLMAHFASSVKVDWDLDPAGLLRHATRVARQVEEQFAGVGIEDDGGCAEESLPLFGKLKEARRGEPSWSLRTLSVEKMQLLLRNSISPLPLHKTLMLLEGLHRKRSRFERHERLALAKALVFSISNLHFGPEVGVAPAKPDAPVLSVVERGSFHGSRFTNSASTKKCAQRRPSCGRA